MNVGMTNQSVASNLLMNSNEIRNTPIISGTVVNGLTLKESSAGINNILIDDSVGINITATSGDLNIISSNNQFELNTTATGTSIIQNTGTMIIGSDSNITIQSDNGSAYINSSGDVALTPGVGSKIYGFSDIDIQGNQIDNCTEINSAGNLVLKSAVGSNVSIPTSSLLMNGNTISNLGDGLVNHQAVNLGQLNTAISTNNTSLDSVFLSLAGGLLTGLLDMGNNDINTTSTPTTNENVTNKLYVDTKASEYLPLTGGTMTGNINL